MFEHIGLILWITVLIIMSAFFSSSETALTAASDARMRQLARNGNKNAKTNGTIRNVKNRLKKHKILSSNKRQPLRPKSF